MALDCNRSGSCLCLCGWGVGWVELPGPDCYLWQSEQPEMSLTVPLLYSGEKTVRSFKWGMLVIALSAISASAMMFST